MKDLLTDPKFTKRVLVLQRGELTEYHIYHYLAGSEKDPHNAMVLEKMAVEEQGHYEIWKKYTGKDVPPHQFKVWAYYLLARIFGLTFGIKLMEKRESDAIATYRELSVVMPETEEILHHEEEHEKEIIGLLDEKSLRYVGSMVLGINDALVEFTGSLAGFTFALQQTRLIAMAGIIMGIAAALSLVPPNTYRRNQT